MENKNPMSEEQDVLPEEAGKRAESIDADWEFLWNNVGNVDFTNQYRNRYVAVFEKTVVGSGLSDSDARDMGSAFLREQKKNIPSARICVDFVGDASLGME
jgi:hypothetical protein